MVLIGTAVSGLVLVQVIGPVGRALQVLSVSLSFLSFYPTFLSGF